MRKLTQKARILKVLLENYPKPVDRQTLAIKALGPRKDGKPGVRTGEVSTLITMLGYAVPSLGLRLEKVPTPKGIAYRVI